MNWILILFLILGLVIFWSPIQQQLEPFVANQFQQNTYLNNDGIQPRVNDLRDREYDFHDNYNDTHSWLRTSLTPGNPAVDETSGPIDETEPNPSTDSNWPFRSQRLHPINEYQQHSMGQLPLLQNILEDLTDQKSPQIKSSDGQLGGAGNGNGYNPDTFVRWGEPLTDREPIFALTPEISRRVRSIQPFFLDPVNQTIRRHNDLYYRDSRYPRDRANLQFIQDPRRFCRQNPHVYPCYRYLSKKLAGRVPK